MTTGCRGAEAGVCRIRGLMVRALQVTWVTRISRAQKGASLSLTSGRALQPYSTNIPPWSPLSLCSLLELWVSCAMGVESSSLRDAKTDP